MEPAANGKPSPSPRSNDDALDLELVRRRRVNVLLDITQMLIALSVTGVTLYVSGKLALSFDSAGGTAASLLLSNAFFLVIGFYFGRSQRPGQRVTDVSREEPKVNGKLG